LWNLKYNGQKYFEKITVKNILKKIKDKKYLKDNGQKINS